MVLSPLTDLQGTLKIYLMSKWCTLPHIVKYFFIALMTCHFSTLFLFYIEMFILNQDSSQEVELVGNPLAKEWLKTTHVLPENADGLNRASKAIPLFLPLPRLHHVGPCQTAALTSHHCPPASPKSIRLHMSALHNARWQAIPYVILLSYCRQHANSVSNWCFEGYTASRGETGARRRKCHASKQLSQHNVRQGKFPGEKCHCQPESAQEAYTSQPVCC